jgi:TIM21
MLFLKRSKFFVPKHTPCIVEAYCLSSSPLRRSLIAVRKHPFKFYSKRTYATQRPEFGGSTNNAGGGIPLGQIHLGSGKVSPQKGMAIKDDITKSWKELTIPQKIVRTGTQTTNLVVVMLSIGVLVLYPLGSKLTTQRGLWCITLLFLYFYQLLRRRFSVEPSIECERIPKYYYSENFLSDKKMQRLIGENMKAYGENSHSRWARNRQIA